MTPRNAMLTVTITRLYGDRDESSSNHRTDDPREAIDRAVAKTFGRAARFFPESEIGTPTTQYGQVGRYIELHCATMDTGRLVIRVQRMQ